MRELLHRSGWMLICIAVLGVQSMAQAHPGTGIVVTEDGTIYFAYGPGSAIWKVAPDGKAEPFVTGGIEQEFRVPHALIADGSDHFITASDVGSVVWRVSADGAKHRIYPPDNWDNIGTVALGGDPFTMTADGRIISIVDDDEHAQSRLVFISLDGKVSPLAGGAPGFADGKGNAARFGPLHMTSFAWGPDRDLYMTEGGSAVRRVTLDGTVTTIAGGSERGSRDGPGREARFDGIMGLTVASNGTIYVAETQQHRIRMIAPDGVVTTFAGAGTKGHADGPVKDAAFDAPVGITHAKDGTLYVLEVNFGKDGEFVRIRRIGSDRQVTTVATIPAERLVPKN